MEMNKEEYFFYEWLILEKKISGDEIRVMSSNEIFTLKKEYLNSKYGMKKLK